MSTRYSPVRVQKGEAVTTVVRQTGGGLPLDLSTATADIAESHPPELAAAMTATIELRDGVWGILASLPAASSGLLQEGNLQWFRVRASFPDGRPDVTRKIWIEVQ